MNRIVEHGHCVGCSACVHICPKHCISMQKDEEGFLYPVIEENQCVHCGLCSTVCVGYEEEVSNEVLQTYAAINNENAKRIRSSSGGIFPLLAEKIIAEDGVVYGVSMTSDCRQAEYVEVTRLEELNKLYGSKYLQGNIGEIYIKVEESLKAGKEVLFCGTPCHSNGLKLFLRKTYANLWTVDFICHGVPSPMLWEKYLVHVENKYKTQFAKVCFRDKKRGWTNFGIKLIDKHQRECYQSKNVNPYMQMFLQDICLRPSCYQCNSKRFRLSDITLGDFWGINQVCSDINDDKGVSVVIVRTEKGAQLLDAVRTAMTMKKVDYSAITEHNTAELTSVERPEKRAAFFRDMLELPFSELEKKYINISFKQRIRDKVDSYAPLRMLTGKILNRKEK